MPNISQKNGLKPVKYLSGAPYNGAANLYAVTAPAAGLWVGDPVTLSGTADTKGIAGAVVGVAGSAIIGVVVGFVVAQAGVSLVGTSIDLTTRSLAANATGYAMVADDPNLLFEIQDGFTTALAATGVGLNCNFVIAAGATTYGNSGTITETAAAAGTATLNLKIIGLVQREDNEFGAFAKLLVKINNHVYGASTGTAGI